MLRLESRRVQRVGRATLAVSLPSKWVKDVRLRKGDFVFFRYVTNGSTKLVLSTSEHDREDKEVLINSDLCKGRRLLERIVVGNYIIGHDTMTIISSKQLRSELIEEVRGITRRLMGIGIIEETPNRVVLQTSIDPMKFPIDTLLRRLYVIVSIIHEDAAQAFLKFNPELAEVAIRRKEEADMVYWLTERLLSNVHQNDQTAEKIGVRNPLQILSNRMIAQFLKIIAEWGVHIAMNAIELEKNCDEIGKELIHEVSQINDMTAAICHKAMSCVFSNNINLANRTIDEFNIVETMVERLQKEICTQAYLKGKLFRIRYFIKKIDPCTISQLNFVIWGIRSIAELGAKIAEIALNTSLETPTELCSIRSPKSAHAYGKDISL